MHLEAPTGFQSRSLCYLRYDPTRNTISSRKCTPKLQNRCHKQGAPNEDVDPYMLQTQTDRESLKSPKSTLSLESRVQLGVFT